MTRAAWTVAVCLFGSAGEVALLAATIPEWAEFFPVGAAFLAFLVGPLVFLAVVAWRRRSHPARTRSLFHLAVVVAAVGLVALTVHLLADPEMRRNPLFNPAVVPLAQWVVVLFAWMRLNAAERIERRRR
jgi:hypothetical protein